MKLDEDNKGKSELIVKRHKINEKNVLNRKYTNQFIFFGVDEDMFLNSSFSDVDQIHPISNFQKLMTYTKLDLEDNCEDLYHSTPSSFGFLSHPYIIAIVTIWYK